MDSEKKRILLADPSPDLLSEITLHPQAQNYEFALVDNGEDCFKKIHTFKPHLVIIDLLLPKMHAIEILKRIRELDQPMTGVIVTSFEVMMQNYQAAIDWGADYFLNKPFTTDRLYELITSFFEGSLTPDPFQPITAKKELHNPVKKQDIFSRPYIKFWGTRGSISVSGHEFIRYGGLTSCLEIHTDNHLVIIDAGTGIAPLGSQIDIEKYSEIDIFISHTHLDHVIGFPFFDPIYNEKCKVNVWAPIGFEKGTKELFTDMLAYAFFPVRLEEMKGNIDFKSLRDQSKITLHDITIECCYTYHPGPTLGFKIEIAGKKIGYITDNEIFIGHIGAVRTITSYHELMKPHLELYEFLSDVDVLIHEAQYFDDEYEKKIGWGHSSISNATMFVNLLGVPEWYVTHHDPKHSDETLQIKFEMHKNILYESGSNCNLYHAKDGMILPF